MILYHYNRLINIALTILIIILISTIIMISNYAFNLKKSVNKYSYEYALLKNVTRIDSIRLIKELFTEELFIDNITVTNIDNKNIELKNLITTSKLIYSFNPESCSQCVNNDILILKELSDSIRYDKIIIIGQFDNINKMKIFKYNNDIKFDCYNFNTNYNLPIEEDENKAPFFMIIDKNLKIHFPKLSIPQNNINIPYFKKVNNYLR